MKIYLMAVAVAVAATPSVAGSYSAPAPAPVVAAVAAPVFSWAGPYVGVQAGGLWSDMRLQGQNLNNLNTMSRSPDPSGALIGAFAGYNWEFGQNLVTGIEGEFNYTNADDDAPGVPPPSFGFLRDRVVGEIDWTAALRARVGYAYNRTLFYAAGGLALARTGIKGFSEGGGSPFDKDDTQVGWTIGGGVEHAMTDHVSLRVDYRYSDYGENDMNFTSAQQTPHDFDLRLRTHEVPAGIAYRF